MGKIIIANWKENPIKLKEAEKLATDIKQKSADFSEKEVIICPPFVYLSSLKEILADSGIKLGAQNIFAEMQGAYTGEISVGMLQDFDCNYAIIGHSERRKYFRETNEEINQKVKLAMKEKVTPILCVGEDQIEKENDQTMQVLESQLTSALNEITEKMVINSGLIVAYEPVWAIGTGNNADPEVVLSVNIFIKKLLIKLYNRAVLKKVNIVYGGSVTSKTASVYMEESGVNGLLVGGVSLKSNEFIKIIESI